MFRSALAIAVLTAAIPLTATTAAGGSQQETAESLEIPLPAEILRIIVPEKKVEAGATLDALLDRGIVQKWNDKILIYFAVEHESQSDLVDRLVDTQFRPLLASIIEATGLGFKRVDSLAEANAVFIFAEASSHVPRFLDFGVLSDWFGADDATFATIEAVFREDRGSCFRFIMSEGDKIVRLVGYASTMDDDTDQKKCLARNLLYGIGLRGPTDSSQSAKSVGTSASSIGLLDQLALEAIYRDGVQPGMTLRKALSLKPPSQDGSQP
jgi:hypothetical protein